MNKKTLLFFGSIFLFGFLLASFLLKGRQAVPPGGSVPYRAPTFAPLAAPDLPIKEIDYVLPTPISGAPQMPRYPYAIDLNKQNAEDIAARLGFTGQPQKQEDIEGLVLFWSEQDKSVTIQGIPPHLSYALTNKPTQRIAGNFRNIAGQQAREFIISALQLSQTDYEVKVESVYYFFVDDDEPKYSDDESTATAAEFHLGFKLPEGPVFPPLGGSWAVVQIGSDYTILRALIKSPPIVRRLDEKTDVVSYREAVERLTSNDNVLFTYQAEALNAKGERPISLKASNIQKAEQGYLFSPDNNELMPVYRFAGTAPNLDGDELINTYSVVSALP